MRALPGTVYLVGAGPGDPGLVTVRGLELIRSCDVVLYDRLVARELIDAAPATAERIFVGKKPGEIHSRQVVADALLLSKAREKKSVVRLKGGDPFVFGRGSEEARLLADAGVPFEIVPGVSSAIAVPAYAGIPVTERGSSSSFAVLTAREEPGDSEVAAAPLTVSADTVVLLMGAGALADAARRLIAGGRDPGEPAAAIEWGTTPKQRTVVSTLAQIADDAGRAGLKAPVTTVVGKVVDARSSIAWFEHRPLLGRRVVVTRSRRQATKLGDRLSALGAEVVYLPVIAIEDPQDISELDAALKTLSVGGYEWVIFTSANAVEKTFVRLRANGFDARAFGSTRVAAVGPATLGALARVGLRADLVPSEHTSNALVAALGPGPGTILWPRVADAPQEMTAVLRAAMWEVDEVTAYRNVVGDPDPAVLELVRTGEHDILTFTSASTVKNFVALVGEIPSDAIWVCIGPETAAAATTTGFDVAAIADPHTTEGLVSAVLEVVQQPDN
ncbi:MAG TPA: uroporphyrinogen-III C-methyltransferase [Actinomycetota bacterium]|nr:uroporphyrinogen-III C-methyltransferase [Actinomycetota bacterium]